MVRRKGPDSPVYQVKSETAGKNNRILHRNLLLSCNFLPLADKPGDAAPPVVQAQQSGNRQQPRTTRPVVPTTAPSEDSDDDQMVDLVPCFAPANIDYNNETTSEVETTPAPEVEPVQDNIVNQLPDGQQLGEHMDQDDANPSQPQAEPPLVENPRPRRVRQPPDRLTYYGPGQTWPGHIFHVSTSTPTTHYPLYHQFIPNSTTPATHPFSYQPIPPVTYGPPINTHHPYIYRPPEPWSYCTVPPDTVVSY